MDTFTGVLFWPLDDAIVRIELVTLKNRNAELTAVKG